MTEEERLRQWEMEHPHDIVGWTWWNYLAFYILGSTTVGTPRWVVRARKARWARYFGLMP